MAILDKITALLKAQGRTQKELCAYLGISRNQFSNWKRGNNRSYVKYAKQIAEYLNVTSDYLFAEDESEAEEKDAEGISRVAEIYYSLSEKNRVKLLELGELYLAEQKRKREAD